MKVHAFTLITAAALVLAPLPAAAQAPEMPKPSAEMEKLAFFEGNWTCQGTIQATPLSPAGKIESTAQIRKDLGGFWQSGTIRATMADMPPFEGMFHTTYDPSAKEFVMLWFDNMGAWAKTTSSGWQGDRMIFQGESHMPGQKAMVSRDTFGRGADGSMTHLWELQIDGKWLKVGEETCRKK